MAQSHYYSHIRESECICCLSYKIRHTIYQMVFTVAKVHTSLCICLVLSGYRLAKVQLLS